MAQLVFEFWSEEVEPIADAIKLVLDGCPTENRASPKYIHYEPTQQGIDWAVQELHSGRVGSFVLHPLSGSIRYAMLNGPDLHGDKRPGYLGVIEYTHGDYNHIWPRLLNVDGLRMVCLGYEEGVEFKENQFAVETFPWDDRFLVIGTVRNRLGDWTVKHGPHYFLSGAE
jgi:hypothetical protein